MNKSSFERARQAMPRFAGVLYPALLSLRGKKTYLGAALAAALAAYHLEAGNAAAAGTMAVLALGLAGLRGKLERIHADPPKSRHETRDTRHEAGTPEPDRSLTRDLARFEDEGGPPMADRKARFDDGGFMSIPEARRRAGLDPPPNAGGPVR